MFKLSSEPRFTHPVKVQVPIDGGHKEEEFKVTFKVIDVAEFGDVLTLEGQQGLLKKIVAGWDELVDDGENAVPYSDERRDQLIAVPFVRAAMFQTYMAAITKTRVGN